MSGYLSAANDSLSIINNCFQLLDLHLCGQRHQSGLFAQKFETSSPRSPPPSRRVFAKPIQQELSGPGAILCCRHRAFTILAHDDHTMEVPGPRGSSKSSVTTACSNVRRQLYGPSATRGPVGAPSGLLSSGYHPGVGAAHDDGDSGHVTKPCHEASAQRTKKARSLCSGTSAQRQFEFSSASSGSAAIWRQ
jgi:hypothetical protein